MPTHYFHYIPRRDRAKGLVPRLRRSSKRFRKALIAGDEKAQQAASKDAWNVMTKLFEILRGEQDNGHLDASVMQVHTGIIAENISRADQAGMLLRKKIDRTRSTSLSLRNTLNKLAHYKTASFRVDGRNAHYLLLRGQRRGEYWAAEILVSTLCKNAATAIQAITD